MEHQTALSENAVERYLLAEMPDSERDEFEEHFFDCPECAAGVRDGAAFVDSLRAGRRKASVVPFRRLIVEWAGIAAAIAVIAILAISNASLRRDLGAALAPHAASVTFLASASRGPGEMAVVVADRKQPQVALDFDITDQSFAGYRCELRDAAGRVRASVPVTAAQAKETVRLLVPTRDLDPGNYTLTVDGLAPAPSRVASFSFVVQVR